MDNPAKTLHELFQEQNFESLGRGVMLFDISGALVEINPAARGVLASRDPLVSMPEVPPCPEWARMVQGFDSGKAMESGRLKIGEDRLAADFFALRADGGLAGVLAYLVERDAPTLHLEDKDEVSRLLDALMESSYDGLWICNAEGVIVRVNRSASSTLGLRPDETVGRNVAELIDEGFISESVTLEVLKRKTVVTIVQHLKNQMKILVTGSPIFNEEGEVVYVVINDRDITLLDRMRRQLDESQALLEHFRSELSEYQIEELETGYYMCKSREMKKVYQGAVKVAASNSTVLITGESGLARVCWPN